MYFKFGYSVTIVTNYSLFSYFENDLILMMFGANTLNYTIILNKS